MENDLKWYVVHTYSGYEEKAKAALLERARSQGLEEKFGDIHIPQVVKETVTKTGKKRVTSSPSFPGYMIVQMLLDDYSMHLVTETPKITGFIGNSVRPRPLPDHEVVSMIEGGSASEGGAPDADSAVPAVPVVAFEKGETIKVIDGPFSNFDGVIDEVRPEKMKVRVLVSIFGRDTPVELEFRQVEKSE